MAERVQLPDVVGLAECILHTGFHDGGVGFVEVLFWMRRDYGSGFSLFGTESLCLGGDIRTVEGCVLLFAAKHYQHLLTFAVHAHHMYLAHIL